MQDNRFELKKVSGMGISDEELLADQRVTAERLGKDTIEYRQSLSGRSIIRLSGRNRARFNRGICYNLLTSCYEPFLRK